MVYEPQSLIEHFFLLSEVPLNQERGHYVLSLVFLSVILAVIGAFTSLRVINGLFKCENTEKTRFHILSVICLSVTIWSMHFIGMLAYNMEMVHTYSIPMTFVSMFAAAIAAFCFVSVVRFLKSNIVTHTLASILLGMSICTMHYSGMQAMIMNSDILYRPDLWALSILVAVLASFVAIKIIYQLKGKATLTRMILSSTTIGIAICGMHYIGMAATIFLPYADCRFSSNQTYYHLAVMVSLVCCIVFIGSYILSQTKSFNIKKITYKHLIKLTPGIVFMIGLAIIICSVTLTEGFIKKRKHARFEHLSSEVEHAIEDRYKLYETGLLAGFGLLESSSYVDIKEWRKFVESQNTIERFPGINGIGYIEYLTVDQVDGFNKVQTNEQGKHFQNHPETEFNDKFVITYIEPLELNQEAVGLDIGFEKNRRAAAEKSIKTRQPTLTRKIKLVQDNKSRAGFLLLMPFFDNANKQNIKGWVYAPFMGDNFLGSLENYGGDEISFAVYDGTEKTEDNLIYQDPAFNNHNNVKTIMTTKTLEIAGQKWTLVFKPTIVFEESLKSYWPIIQITIGLIITGLLSLIIYNMNHKTATIRRRVEEQTFALAEERKFSELVINTIPDLIFVKDEQFRIVQANQSFMSLYPKDIQDKVIGHTTIEHFSKEEADLFLAEDRKAFRRGKSRTHEKIKLHNGKVITVDTLKTRFEDLNGKRYILGVARDISELQKIRENLEETVEKRTIELKKAKNEAEKANDAKDMFLANMSHELRTPLNSIIGLVRILMREDGLSSDHIQTLGVVDKSSTSLLEIVNDVLDISKIEAGKIELENTPFNISGLTHSLLDQIKPLVSKRGLELRSNEAELPFINVIGDQFRLSRILLNLASNAIKYTNEGHVDINTTIEEKDEDHIVYRCVVTDTGIGIPENKIATIFDKFTQAEESIERRFGGTGLGLNITKHLVKLMGGKISVESELSKGSTFTVEIPFKKSTQEDVQTIPYDNTKKVLSNENRVPISEAKILVAEDHEFNQIFIMKLLKRFGAKNFHLVTDGKDAFEEYRSKEYDLILMDCHMPKMNGYEITRAIREMEQDKDSHKHGSHTPIIAMTADAMVGTREACIDAGMNDYISKPIMEDEFQSIIREWLILGNHTRNGNESSIQSVAPANLAILKEYADHNPDTEKELLSIFYKKSKKDMEILGKNLRGGKGQAWSEAAHSLKGSAGYIGATNLRDLCAEAQDMIQATGKERKALYSGIEKEYQAVCDYLQSSNIG